MTASPVEADARPDPAPPSGGELLSQALERLLLEAPGEPPRVIAAQGRLGAENLSLRAVAVVREGWRWARHVELRGDQGTLALNCCFFPRLDDPRPLWSFELLLLRGRLHLLALDALPTLPDQHPATRQQLRLCARKLALTDPAALPPWAHAVSSPEAIFWRAPGAGPSVASVAAVIEPALREALYLAPGPRDPGPEAAQSGLAQRTFLQAMITHDPALAYLARAFGAGWARSFCDEVFFPSC